MTSLLDIAARSEKVSIPGHDEPVEVWGVSARGIAALMDRFPAIRSAFSPGSAGADAVKLVQLVPDAIATIIAMGVHKAGDQEYEAAADALPADVQARLLEPIIRLTVGEAGFTPFVVRVVAMMGGEMPTAAALLNGAGTSGKAPDGTSPSP